MITTTIEQSQKLIKLGIDVNTADMMWDDWNLIDEEWKLSVGYYPEIEKDYGRKCYPAWSLSALLEVMPRNPSITYHLFSSLMPHETDVDKTNGWVCDRTEFVKMDEGTFHEGTKRLYECFKGERPIDAAYEMVCWLLEQGLIKKGDNDEGDRRKTSTY